MKNTYGTMTDEELCGAVVNGSAEAEEELCRRSIKLVRSCARPLFLIGGDSEDLIQEGMIALIAAIRTYRPDKASFRTYAERCIRNRLYTLVKSASKGNKAVVLQTLSLDSSADANPSDSHISCPSAEMNPEDSVIDRETVLEYRESWKRLLSRYEADVLSLYLLGLSYQEIAEKTGKSEKSVDNAVQRIRRKIVQNITQA